MEGTPSSSRSRVRCPTPSYARPHWRWRSGDCAQPARLPHRGSDLGGSPRPQPRGLDAAVAVPPLSLIVPVSAPAPARAGRRSTRRTPTPRCRSFLATAPPACRRSRPWPCRIPHRDPARSFREIEVRPLHLCRPQPAAERATRHPSADCSTVRSTGGKVMNDMWRSGLASLAAIPMLSIVPAVAVAGWRVVPRPPRSSPTTWTSR